MTMQTQSHVEPTIAKTSGSTGYPSDQLYMLKLCLELQVEALLLTLGSSAVASRSTKPGALAPGGRFAAADGSDLPWSRWLAEDLELACALTRDCVNDGVALPSTMGLPTATSPGDGLEALAARYSAMAAVVGEMLERTDAVKHSHAAAQLTCALKRCEERLEELIGPAIPDRVGVASSRESEPGHFLG